MDCAQPNPTKTTNEHPLQGLGLLRSFVCWILPAKCFYCKAQLNAQDETELCHPCLLELQSNVLKEEGLCRMCSHPLSDGRCPHCNSEGVAYHFKAATCAFASTGRIKQFMYDYKFKRKRRFAAVLGKLLLKHHGPFLGSWDAFVPVTLNQRRLWRRDFCPVLEVLRIVQKTTKTPIVRAVRRRGRFQRAQHQKDKQERTQITNQLAFRGRTAKRLEGRRLLVIDDIFTTGSTLNAYAKMVLENTKQVHHLEVFAFLRTLVATAQAKHNANANGNANNPNATKDRAGSF